MFLIRFRFMEDRLRGLHLVETLIYRTDSFLNLSSVAWQDKEAGVWNKESLFWK